MPMIKVETSVNLTAEKRDVLKAELGKAISGKMTAKVCEILQVELGIAGDAVYVSYFGTDNWGWNGGNF